MRTREFVKVWTEYNKAVDKRDIDGVLRYFTDDATFYEPRNPPIKGKAALKEYFMRAMSRSVATESTWHRYVVNRNRACIEFTFSFTRPQTWQRFEARGVILIEMEKGKFKEYRHYFDTAQLNRPAS